MSKAWRELTPKELSIGPTTRNNDQTVWTIINGKENMAISNKYLEYTWVVCSVSGFLMEGVSCPTITLTWTSLSGPWERCVTYIYICVCVSKDRLLHTCGNTSDTLGNHWPSHEFRFQEGLSRLSEWKRHPPSSLHPQLFGTKQPCRPTRNLFILEAVKKRKVLAPVQLDYTLLWPR